MPQSFTEWVVILASQSKGNILRTKLGFDDPKGAYANRKKKSEERKKP